MNRHHEGGSAIPRSVAFVREICVTESSRGLGVGQRLMEHVENWARARQLGSIELNVWATNQRALAFYRAMGFSALRYELTKPV